ncbi:MAG: tetratricopeptide repeat-containing sensor histidine kinase [Bacteroidales bacterium]|nr:tetratricopeptide repeat-containing sensor histidine kinase [Bacteroidales bacterium]
MRPLSLVLTALMAIALPAPATIPPHELLPMEQRVKRAMEGFSVDEQREVLEAAIGLGRQYADTVQLSRWLMDYSVVLVHSARLPEAIAVLNELQGYVMDRDQELEARCVMQQGVVNFFIGNYDEALLHYQNAQKLALDLGNNVGAAIAENNIANIYQKRGDYPLALQHYQSCLALQPDSSMICNTLFNIGTCLGEQGEQAAARRQFEHALQVASAIGDAEIMALSLSQLGVMHMQLGQYRESLRLMEQGLDIAQGNGYRTVAIEILKHQSEVYEHLGLHKQALQSYRLFAQVRDTLRTEQSEAMLKEMEVKYKLHQKERELAEQQEHVEQQRKFMLLLSVLLTLLLLLTTMLLLFLRLRRKRNRELAALNRTQTQLLSIMSHDLRNPAIAQRNALELMISAADAIPPSMLKEQCQLLLTNTQSQIYLVQNLLSWASMQFGNLSYTPVRFDLAAAADEALDLLRLHACNKHINIDNAVPIGSAALADRAMFTIVVRNLVANAIKFSPLGSSVELSLSDSEESWWAIAVRDHGVGIAPERLSRIFVLEERRSSTLGTQGEQGSGLGLPMCRELVERWGGRIEVNSQPGQGSCFTFTIRRG